LPGGFAEGKWGTAALEAIQAVMALPNEALPKPDSAPELPGNLGSTVELLKVLLKHKAEKHGVAPRLLATTDELERIAAGRERLTGWRQELFGDDAEALRDGKVLLGLEHGKVKITRVE
jgi:ribonuclease D